MSSTSVHDTTPGLRRAGKPVIRVEFDGVLGDLGRAMLEGILGVCGGSTIDGPAWANKRGDQTGARLLSAPADIMSRVEGFPVVLADGVTATVVYIESSDCEMCGPGAKFLMATRGNPGLRQAASSFPTLPDGWIGAILAAQRNGQFLRPGAATEASSKPAAAAKPSVSALPEPVPSVPSARAEAPKLDARELARRSAIVAKVGIDTPERRALVNAKIARGDPA